MTRTNSLKPVLFSDIAGWAHDDHQLAHAAFCKSASEILEHGRGFKRTSLYGGERSDWLEVCSKALTTKNPKEFFEAEFQALTVNGENESLFTGYYEPHVKGSLGPSREFCVPLYTKPPELVAFNKAERDATGHNCGCRNNSAKAYFTRQEIEQGAIGGRRLEICYLNSWAEAYFIHIQGNGRILLDNGKALRLSFAAKNGPSYKSIGRVLLDRGIGTPQSMSMQFLKEWMSANPHAARALMYENPSFIFFAATDQIDPQLGAVGAAKVPLTPLRSIAVDRSVWAFGTPLFVSTHTPAQQGGSEFRNLVIAQDTGSAIKGVVRGDIYWGWGPAAEACAGHMKQPGQIIALLPRSLAMRLIP